MEKSSKQVWAARLLALLVMSFGLGFLTSMTPENKQPFRKRVEIRANENLGEIVAAVEKLNRDDIHIKIKDSSWCIKNPIFLWSGVGLFISLGCFLGIYHAIYCVIGSFFNRKEKNDSLLNPKVH